MRLRHMNAQGVGSLGFAEPVDGGPMRPAGGAGTPAGHGDASAARDGLYPGVATGRTITALLEARAARSPDDPAQWELTPAGGWVPTEWSALRDQVAALARGLRHLGASAGVHVAILAAGTPWWDRLHLAALAARAVVVGLDPLAGAAQLNAQLALTRPVGLVVDRWSALDALSPAARASLRFVVSFEGPAAERTPAADGTVLVTPEEVSRLGEADRALPWNHALPDDPAWVIFTSGTTGEPKGLRYRHHQVRLAVDAIVDAFGDIAEGARLASWLPLANPFQRIVNLCAVARGAQTYYVPDPREVMRHLPVVRPHVFIGVPRFFEKFHAGATASLDAAGPLRARLARWALRVGERRAACERAGHSAGPILRMAHKLADAFVLRRVRAAFGGELRYLVSGSAAMPPWLLERLHGAGLLVLEAYGLSECIVPVAANRAGAFRFGTVGRAMAGNEIRLAADGELLLRSAGVFDGYLGSEAGVPIDADGWLATGDFAEIDADGFVRLVGRKSEVFKTSTGRRVAPAAVEAVLRGVPGVEHAAVFGEGRRSLLAVVAVGAGAGSAPALRDAARRALQALPDYLRPAGLVVSRRPFAIDAGELTPNLKVRRVHVRQRFAAALDALAALVDAPGGGAPRVACFGADATIELLVL